MTTKYLLIKAKGGMGNRILCLLSGLLYAEISKRRPIVDWTDTTYSDDGENAFQHFFADTGIGALSELPAEATVTPSIWDGHLDWSVSQMMHKYSPDSHSSPLIYRKYCCDLKVDRHDQDVAVYWSYVPKIQKMRSHLVGEFAAYSKMSEIEILRDVLRRRLVLAADILEQVDEFALRYLSGPSIGLHIRHTDLKIPLRLFEAQLEKITSSTGEETIFLATDDPNVEHRFQSRFSNVVVTEKWFPDDGQHLHQNPTCPDKIKAGHEALADIYLLACCKQLIYGRSSTFSFISRLICDIAADQIFDVERHRPIAIAKRLVHRHA